MEQNKRFSTRRTIESTLLHGMLVCGECGYAYYRTSTKTSSRKLYYYRCLGSDNYRHINGRVCQSKPIRQDYLGGTIWQQVVGMLEDPALIRREISIRPIYHQTDVQIEAHIFVASMAYCLQVTLKHQARQLAPGLTPRALLEKFSTIQMVDVHLPTTDGRYLILPRYTHPDRDLSLLLAQLKLTLPKQPPPKIVAGAGYLEQRLVVPT